MNDPRTIILASGQRLNNVLCQNNFDNNLIISSEAYIITCLDMLKEHLLNRYITSQFVIYYRAF